MCGEEADFMEPSFYERGIRKGRKKMRISRNAVPVSAFLCGFFCKICKGNCSGYKKERHFGKRFPDFTKVMRMACSLVLTFPRTRNRMNSVWWLCQIVSSKAVKTIETALQKQAEKHDIF